MIYEKELTNDLIVMYGEEILNCSKPIIRNKLEDTIYKYKDIILNELKDVSKMEAEENRALLGNALNTEYNFMTNYMAELEH